MVSSAGLVELRPPVQPMVARAAAELPDDERGVLSFETKLDGRLIVFHTLDGRVML